MKAALAISLLFLCFAAGASAATLHPVGDFARPIHVTSAPADPNELYVAEREGRVVRVANGATGVFADITDLVQCCESERGLLSIALAPDFGTSGRIYVAYTGEAAAGGAKGDVHLDAFRHDSGALLREQLLTIPHEVNPNHNGGQLQFGPDGFLYLSTGDGGGAGDPLENGQNPISELGKILRIEPIAGADAEIWSLGLRNPWRFSFDRTGGDMVIADVGQGAREEINLAPSPAVGVVGGNGANYGWNCREGFEAYPLAPDSCDGASGFTEPVFDYPHSDPGNGAAHGCSITGGYVVRDPSLDELYGRYVYADFCVGAVRSLLLPDGAGMLATDDRSEGLSVDHPVSFGEDSSGRIYVIAQAGSVYRFEGSAQQGGLAGQADPAAAAAANEARSAELRLRARAHRLKDGVKLALTARLTPCTNQAGDAVQLNRGGTRFARKRLDIDCSSRFRLRVDHRSTFRALLPGQGYRSQVLTIALAKPRP